MKRLFFILTAVVLMVSCADDSLMIDAQVSAIEAHLKRTYGEDFDGFVSDGVFRHIGGNAREENQRGAPLEKGERISVWFEAYMFGSAPARAPYFTNIPEVAEQLPVNTSNWSLEALEFKIGDRAMLSAVENALIGCQRGDSVEVYITSNHAYGNKPFGNVPENTPLMFKIEIE